MHGTVRLRRKNTVSCNTVPCTSSTRRPADRRPQTIRNRTPRCQTIYRKFVLLYNCAKEDISNSFLICLINVYPVDFMNHKLSRLRYPTASRTVGTSLLANNQVQTSGNATLWHQHRVQLRWANLCLMLNNQHIMQRRIGVSSAMVLLCVQIIVKPQINFHWVWSIGEYHLDPHTCANIKDNTRTSSHACLCYFIPLDWKGWV